MSTTPAAPVRKRATPAPKTKPVTAKPVTAKRAPQGANAKTRAPVQAKTSPAQGVVQPSAASPSKPLKEKKVKVVRDSFTIPKAEFAQIAEMKKRAMALGVEVKKSELIRAGLQLIAGLQDTAFKKALAAVPTLKTGRPAKD